MKNDEVAFPPDINEVLPVLSTQNPSAKKSRFEGLAFDQYVANYYVNKIQSCKSRKIKFKLSLTQVKNMLRAKKCPILGIELTHTGCNHPISQQRDSDITIDRINSDGDYETGNVIAMSRKANVAKGAFEGVMGKESIQTFHIFSKFLNQKGFK